MAGSVLFSYFQKVLLSMREESPSPSQLTQVPPVRATSSEAAVEKTRRGTSLDSIPCSTHRTYYYYYYYYFFSSQTRRIIVVVMLLLLYCALAWLGFIPQVVSLAQPEDIARRQSQSSSAEDGLLEVFQVYQPVPFAAGASEGCDLDMLLMDHVFAFSYGQPFVGNYVPPQCEFDTVRINFTVTSKGRQYDRLGLMYLSDTEVFRTSTAEPTADGIVWTYVKDLSMYNSLWKEPQKLIFDLGNLVNNIYTGTYNATLTAHFSRQNNVPMADLVLPISARRSATNSPSAFSLPGDKATVLYSIPAAASRAVVSISACGQSTEEFWWSNVLNSDTNDFTNTVGQLYGYSPFREIQLYIDGMLAGVVWPFPIIFTGGVAPGFWRPIVGIDAFDLRQPEIDISPFLPMLTDGQAHSFEIRVVGLNDNPDGSATLSQSVGSYWVVSGSIFVYMGDKNSPAHPAADKRVPTIDARPPKISVTRHLSQNAAGENDSLSYSVAVERTFSVKSAQHTWSQTLSYSNHGLLNQQGLSQVNKQNTDGQLSFTGTGPGRDRDRITFSYPLVVNSTYGLTSTSLTIDAWMSRGLNIDASGVPGGVSTYTLSSGPSSLHTKQWGTAHYSAVTGSNSTSSGETTDVFNSEANGQSYSRTVTGVNGTVAEDTQAQGSSSSGRHGHHQSQDALKGAARDSARSMLGRGPGASKSEEVGH